MLTKQSTHGLHQYLQKLSTIRIIQQNNKNCQHADSLQKGTACPCPTYLPRTDSPNISQKRTETVRRQCTSTSGTPPKPPKFITLLLHSFQASVGNTVGGRMAYSRGECWQVEVGKIRRGKAYASKWLYKSTKLAGLC